MMNFQKLKSANIKREVKIQRFRDILQMLCCTGSPYSPVKVGLATVVVASWNNGLSACRQKKLND